MLLTIRTHEAIMTCNAIAKAKTWGMNTRPAITSPPHNHQHSKMDLSL